LLTTFGAWKKLLVCCLDFLVTVVQLSPLGGSGAHFRQNNNKHITKGTIMRILMNVKIPHQQFNAAVKDGSAGSKLNRILEAMKPEAVYFTEQNGCRGALLVVDLPDASKIPALAEPWFLTFQADVECRIAMTPDDLKKAGLDELGKKWS
jgi:hypothetical protein